MSFRWVLSCEMTAASARRWFLGKDIIVCFWSSKLTAIYHCETEITARDQETKLDNWVVLGCNVWNMFLMYHVYSSSILCIPIKCKNLTPSLRKIYHKTIEFIAYDGNFFRCIWHERLNDNLFCCPSFKLNFNKNLWKPKFMEQD